MVSEEIKIEGSKTIPTISFQCGKLNISGRSVPSDSKKLFEPLLQVFYTYSLNPEEITEFNIQLEYLNSDTNRALMNLLFMAEKLYNEGKKVVVRWYYRNNDQLMFEQGNIFKSLVEVPFSFVTI
jgi:hypothetical protein